MSGPLADAIILHDYWRSSASYRVRIALALKGLPYDRVPVDLAAGEQRRAAHHAVNPQGLVPALQIDRHVLTQSLAILEYLEETRPEPALLPKDAVGRATVRAISMAIACEIHPISNLNVLERVQTIGGPAARTDWNRDNIAAGLASIEQLLDHPGYAGHFCHGDQPSMADCTLIPQLYNATRWHVAFDHLPRITTVAQTCQKHPAFQQAHPDNFAPSRKATEPQGEKP